MRIRSALIALLVTTSLAQAQVVSPLGGSTNNPGSAPPALAAPAPSSPAAPAPTPAPAATAPASPAPAARTGHARRTIAERFAAANSTHDGKLTLEQAKAGRMVAVARDFSAIDKNKRGYVTLDEIKAHQIDQRAARRAAKAH